MAAATGEYRTAIRHFNHAIELHPTLARAYRERALATFNEGSPQVSGYASLTRPSALRRSIQDHRRALALGHDAGDVLPSLGFCLILQGLPADDEHRLREAVRVLARAVRLRPTQPLPALNLGVALAAVGRERQAHKTFAAAVRKLVFIDGDREKRRSAAAQEDLLAGALTDLELLRSKPNDRRARSVQRLKAALVDGVAAAGRRSTVSPARMGNFDAAVYPSQAGWRANDESQFSPPRDRLSLQWYHQVSDGRWHVLPEISGLAGQPNRGHRSNRGYQFESSDGKGRFQIKRALELTRPAQCLPSGKYRLEAYLNGRLVDETVVNRVGHTELEPDVDRQVGITLCRPREWHHQTDPRTAGILTTWRSPDGAKGAVVMRLDRHTDPRRRKRPGHVPYSDQDALRTLEWALRRFPNAVPSGLRPISFDPTFPFAGFQSAVQRGYDYPPSHNRPEGRVLAAAAYDYDNVGWVGAVFGPKEYVKTDAEGYNILLSLTRKARGT